MDANGQRFWMWSRERDWPQLDGCAVSASVGTPHSATPSATRPLLALAALRPPPQRIDGAARELLAESDLALLPLLRDAFGTLGRWDASTQALMGFGAFDGEVERYRSEAADAPHDLALDADDLLLLAFDEGLEVVDLRQRFAPQRLAWPLVEGGLSFRADALACDGRVRAQGPGRWALDRGRRRLARIAGTPWPDRPPVDYDPGTFRPVGENADALRIELLPDALPADARPVALAASAKGRLAVASWGADGELLLQCFDARGRPHGGRLRLAGAAHAHALAWLDESRVALRLADLAEVLVYALPPTLDAGQALSPQGLRFPAADAARGRFVAAPIWPPHLPLAPTADQGSPHTRALVPLAWRGYVGEGRAEARPVDSGQLEQCWHRLMLEAILPAGCGVLVELAAGDENRPPAADDWWPHWFGDRGAAPPLPADVPQGVWQPDASELPHRAGLLDCPPQPQRVGLFSALVQRAGRRLRSLRGRFVWCRLTLYGNGRSTPEIAALRLWGSRFSYVRQYLPELYRDESVFDRDAAGSATPHDFLERFTQLFESVLTPLEDRVAEARVLSHPNSAPEAALEWLATWTGERFPPLLPTTARRAWLQAAPRLRALRGTLGGLQLGLDIASGGALSRGRIVVIEDFRLRRTLATLLGVDLERRDDPLLPGLRVSGNSFVGDTLILGDSDDAQARREFLALFGEGIENDAEAATVASVYERTAHRTTVLVHEGLDDALRAQVADVATELAPAHVSIKVIAAREPFLVGIAALVGHDSYLRAPQPPGTARLDRSDLGRGDRLRGGGALDWRLDGIAPQGAARPVAALRAPALLAAGEELLLDGSASSAAAGRRVSRWRFTRKS